MYVLSYSIIIFFDRVVGIFFLKNYVYQFHEKTRSIRTYYYIIFLLVYAFFMMRNFSKTSKKSVGERERESSRSDLKFLYLFSSV